MNVKPAILKTRLFSAAQIPFPCSSLLILGFQINLSLVKELHIREKRAILFERVESRARVAESRRCARDIL